MSSTNSPNKLLITLWSVILFAIFANPEIYKLTSWLTKLNPNSWFLFLLHTLLFGIVVYLCMKPWEGQST